MSLYTRLSDRLRSAVGLRAMWEDFGPLSPDWPPPPEEPVVPAVAQHDKVLTQGGLHGIVAVVEEASLMLQIDHATFVRLSKDAVVYVWPKS